MAPNAFNVTASTLIPLMQMFEMGGVYICASVGAAERIEEFKSIGLSDADISRIHPIDLVSSGILGVRMCAEYNNIHFVDSPIMLESVLLRTLHILRMTTSVVISYFSTASMLLRYTTMIECLQNIFTPSFTLSDSEEVLSVILNVPDQTPPLVLVES